MRIILFLLLLTACQKQPIAVYNTVTEPLRERSTFVISGKVIWEGNRLGAQSGVAGVIVTLSGAESQTATTGADGLYSFVVSTVGDYELTAIKNRPPPFCINGVTAADAYRIQQHVTGAFPLADPYKTIASDCNLSSSVSAADASFVIQAVIGNPVIQGVFSANTWRFVPQSYTFPDPLIPFGAPLSIALTGVSNDQTSQNFIGLKLGDVNATANPIN